MIKQRVINFFSGPSSGKSTSAATLFAGLKNKGVNCELVTEFAKDVVWSESYKQLEDQVYIFGNHYHRFWRLVGKVDVIITDSPLIMSLAYTDIADRELVSLVAKKHKSFENLNIWVERSSDYNPVGRTQTETQSLAIDNQIRQILGQNNEDIHLSLTKSEISSGEQVINDFLNK